MGAQQARDVAGAPLDRIDIKNAVFSSSSRLGGIAIGTA
jgi:hypothetical protein